MKMIDDGSFTPDEIMDILSTGWSETIPGNEDDFLYQQEMEMKLNQNDGQLNQNEAITGAILNSEE